MYRLKEIQAALLPVVGWAQSYSPQTHIDERLTITESGLTFQDAHPLLTLYNMHEVMPDDWNLQYPEWNMLLEYKAGNKVFHNSLVWIAIRDSIGEEPTASDFNNDYSRMDYGNPYWRPYNSLSDYLERITKNGINTVVQRFVQEKQLTKQTKNILERRTFFNGAGRIRNTTENQGNIVGFEIVPLRSMGVTAKIDRIGLQFTGATGNVHIYVFHSSQYNPVYEYDLNFDLQNGGFKWFDLKDCYLPNMGKGTNSGGSWYICYNQDELPRGMEAINVSKDWSRDPCGTCNIGSVEAWRELTKYVQVSPFKKAAPSSFEEFPELWDISENIYTNTFNYGLNAEISVGCDLTDFIISQRSLFQNVIQLQVAAIALRTIAMNPYVRVNRSQVNASRTDILYELDGNTNGVRPNGLGYELLKAYKALRIDTEGIDRICLGCSNRGVRYTSI